MRTISTQLITNYCSMFCFTNPFTVEPTLADKNRLVLNLSGRARKVTAFALIHVQSGVNGFDWIKLYQI